MTERLVLGTVQLGMPYGVANKTGQPDGKVATAIIDEAWNNGIKEFDTAQGYGSSETVLGDAFAELKISDQVRVISKLHPQIDHSDQKILVTALDESLKKLRVPALYGLLLHNEDFLALWKKGLGENMRYLVKTGKVKKVGVSVYSVDKAKQALKLSGIDMIQLPANVLDQRFETAGFFSEAKKKDIEVYVRSVFLQGLVLMQPRELPDYLADAKKYVEQFNDLSDDFALTPRELAMGYIGSQLPEAKIVFGVESVEQLKENILAWKKNYPTAVNEHVRKMFVNVPEEIINPTLWKVKS